MLTCRLSKMFKCLVVLLVIDDIGLQEDWDQLGSLACSKSQAVTEDVAVPQTLLTGEDTALAYGSSLIALDVPFW